MDTLSILLSVAGSALGIIMVLVGVIYREGAKNRDQMHADLKELVVELEDRLKELSDRLGPLTARLEVMASRQELVMDRMKEGEERHRDLMRELTYQNERQQGLVTTVLGIHDRAKDKGWELPDIQLPQRKEPRRKT